MRMLRRLIVAFFLITVCAEADQRCTVYKNNTGNWSDDDHTSSSETTEIYWQIWPKPNPPKTDRKCLVRGQCAAWGTLRICGHVKKAADILKEEVGPDSNVRLVVFGDGPFEGAYNPRNRNIRLKGSYRDRGAKNGDVVGHEVGHDFFQKHMRQYKTGDFEDIVDAKGLTEGIAYILQENMPRVSVAIRRPSRSVDETRDYLIDEDIGNADELGHHLYWAYKVFERETPRLEADIARDAFFDAVRHFDDIDSDGVATFLEFREAVLKAAPEHYADEISEAFSDAGIAPPGTSESRYAETSYTWDFGTHTLYTLDFINWEDFACSRVFGTFRYSCIRRQPPVGD